MASLLPKDAGFIPAISQLIPEHQITTPREASDKLKKRFLIRNLLVSLYIMGTILTIAIFIYIVLSVNNSESFDFDNILPILLGSCILPGFFIVGAILLHAKTITFFKNNIIKETFNSAFILHNYVKDKQSINNQESEGINLIKELGIGGFQDHTQCDGGGINDEVTACYENALFNYFDINVGQEYTVHSGNHTYIRTASVFKGQVYVFGSENNIDKMIQFVYRPNENVDLTDPSSFYDVFRCHEVLPGCDPFTPELNTSTHKLITNTPALIDQLFAETPTPAPLETPELITMLMRLAQLMPKQTFGVRMTSSKIALLVNQDKDLFELKLLSAHKTLSTLESDLSTLLLVCCIISDYINTSSQGDNYL